MYSESAPNTMAEALKQLDIRKENDDRPEQPEDTSYYYTGIKEKDGKSYIAVDICVIHVAMLVITISLI